MSVLIMNECVIDILFTFYKLISCWMYKTVYDVIRMNELKYLFMYELSKKTFEHDVHVLTQERF